VPERQEVEVSDGGPAGSAVTVAPRRVLRRLTLAHSFEWMSALGLLVALIGLCVLVSTQSEFFLTTGNLVNVGRATAYLGVVSAAATVVLICGELDLSVGAIIALGGVASAEALQAGYSGGLSIAAGLGVGLLAGLVNAALIVGLGVNALICTIGTQFAFRGLAFIWTSGTAVDAFGYSGFAYLGQGQIGGVYVSTIVLVAVFVVLGLLLSQTRYGSNVYTIGGSRIAARRVGVHVNRVRTSVYLLSGVAAALGGIIVVSANGSASATSGTGSELVIISAVIIGGTGLAGGRGNLVGTFLGVAFLGVLQNGMDLVGLQAYWQLFVQGVVLIVAITVDEQFRRRREREE
jgi:ribose/xylose/arabinose/galactoside ABC-type transport system permease subunit